MVNINTKSLKSDILEAYREAKSQLHMANMEIAELKEAVAVGDEEMNERVDIDDIAKVLGIPEGTLFDWVSAIEERIESGKWDVCDKLRAGWQKDKKIIDHYRKVMSEIVALEVEDHFDDVSDELVDYIKGLKANVRRLEKAVEQDVTGGVSGTIKGMMRIAMDEVNAEDKAELWALKIEIEKNKKERGIMTDIADANGWDIYPTDNEESDVELTDSDEETPKCEECQATEGGSAEGCDHCGITRFHKGSWWKEDDSDEETPKCDICGCDGTDMGADEWNGETGCCLKCEADEDSCDTKECPNFDLLHTGKCKECVLKAGWAEEVTELSEKMSKKMKM